MPRILSPTLATPMPLRDRLGSMMILGFPGPHIKQNHCLCWARFCFIFFPGVPGRNAVGKLNIVQETAACMGSAPAAPISGPPPGMVPHHVADSALVTAWSWLFGRMLRGQG